MAAQFRRTPSKNGAPLAKPDPCSTTAELEAMFQRVEEAWDKATEKLDNIRVPAEVRVKVDQTPIEATSGKIIGQRKCFLAYCRHKAQRRICYIVEKCYDDDEREDLEEIKPVVDWPIDVRLEMFDHFKSLYDQAIAVASSYIPKIKESVEEFEESLELLDE